jgi:hypothetical protein
LTEPDAGHGHHHPFEILARRFYWFADAKKPDDDDQNDVAPENVHPFLVQQIRT